MKKTKEQRDDGLVPGTLVSYYDNGWYHGYIEEIIKSTVWIKPIGPKGSNPRSVSADTKDVKLVYNGKRNGKS